jgi:hypothetical protein
MKMLIGIGVVVVFFSILYAFAANLQHTKFEYLLPSYIGIIISGVLLFLGDWLRVKNTKKRISVLAILCFLFGFLSFVIMSGGIEIRMSKYFASALILLICLSSIIAGIYSKKNNKNVDCALIGNAASVVGITFSIVSILLTFMVVFIIK